MCDKLESENVKYSTKFGNLANLELEPGYLVEKELLLSSIIRGMEKGKVPLNCS